MTNTGPPIPPADVDRLFQPFQRLDRRRANYADGHGLGLSIVRAIATAHDATITAHPMPDGGLSVSVIFPRPASPAASPGNHSQSGQQSLEIELATSPLAAQGLLQAHGATAGAAERASGNTTKSAERLIDGPIRADWDLPDVAAAIDEWLRSDGYLAALQNLGDILHDSSDTEP